MSDVGLVNQVTPDLHPSERRLLRLAFDLHDGPLQDVAALLGEIRLFRSQLEETMQSHARRDTVLGRVEDIEARLLCLDNALRDLLHEPRAPGAGEPFDQAMEEQVHEVLQGSGIRSHLLLEGDFDALSESQRIALLRVVHEALANVRRHSGATETLVHVVARGGVWAEIRDDGRGFDVDAALLRAARSGRLGLVGMAERVRLLGGVLEVESRPGGPTRVELSLPRWLAAEAA